MLQNSKAALFFVFILTTTQLFCMQLGGKRVNPHDDYQTIQENGEFIYIIGQTIQESFDDVMKNLNELVNMGQFIEAKIGLENHCSDLKYSLNLDGSPNCSVEYLKELLQEFGARCKLLLKKLDNNYHVLVVGLKDTIRSLGMLVALSTGLTGIIKVDSGVLLVAFLIAIIVCVEPTMFFAVSMILGVLTTIYEPNLAFNSALLTSFFLGISLIKVNNKRVEKNRQVHEVKELISGFEAVLRKKIKEYSSTHRVEEFIAQRVSKCTYE